eukprot:UN00832
MSRPPADAELVEQLATELEFGDAEVDNGRDQEINHLYENQIFHAYSRFRGPKISDGFEELVASQHPLQVIYPDKFSTTGLAYQATAKAMYETHNPSKHETPRFCFCCLQQPPPRFEGDVEPMLIYSQETPDVEKTARFRWTRAGVWLFTFITLILGIVCYIVSPFTYKDSDVWFLHQPPDVYDVCNLVIMAISLVILGFGMLVRNPAIILTFVVLFCVDSFF